MSVVDDWRREKKARKSFSSKRNRHGKPNALCTWSLRLLFFLFFSFTFFFFIRYTYFFPFAAPPPPSPPPPPFSRPTVPDANTNFHLLRSINATGVNIQDGSEHPVCVDDEREGIEMQNYVFFFFAPSETFSAILLFFAPSVVSYTIK